MCYCHEVSLTKKKKCHCHEYSCCIFFFLILILILFYFQRYTSGVISWDKDLDLNPSYFILLHMLCVCTCCWGKKPRSALYLSVNIKWLPSISNIYGNKNFSKYYRNISTKRYQILCEKLFGVERKTTKQLWKISIIKIEITKLEFIINWR